MGCTTAKQITIYHKDDLPECINLTFNFDKAQLPKDFRNDVQIPFDNNDILKGAKCFHIERLVVYIGHFIAGISVTYKLDNKIKTVEHLAAGHSSTHVEKLILEEFEHIEYVECSYSNQGLHSLVFKTNTGKAIVCDGAVGAGAQERKINLREHNKALIGFRGVYSTHMLDLFMYVSLRLDIITET